MNYLQTPSAHEYMKQNSARMNSQRKDRLNMDLQLGSPINPIARSPNRNRDVTVTSDLSEVTMTNVVHGVDIKLNEVTQSDVLTQDQVKDDIDSDLGDVTLNEPLN